MKSLDITDQTKYNKELEMNLLEKHKRILEKEVEKMREEEDRTQKTLRKMVEHINAEET